MPQASSSIMRWLIGTIWLYSLCFDASVSFLGSNQKVNVVVLANFRWIHSFVVFRLAFFLNCVTPDVFTFVQTFHETSLLLTYLLLTAPVDRPFVN